MEHRQVKYLVIGGIAVNLYGFARATGDLDLMISFDARNITSFIDTMKSLKFQANIPVELGDLANPEKRQEWLTSKNMKVFSLFNPEKPMEQVDVLLENIIEFEAAYQRKEVVEIDDIKIPIICIDDLIKLKEQAGRERDDLDIKTLNKIREIKDEEYDVEHLKRCMHLSAKQKLEFLEELNKFLAAATPAKNKKIWEKLKKLGW